jgi:hypothetical protein
VSQTLSACVPLSETWLTWPSASVFVLTFFGQVQTLEQV